MKKLFLVVMVALVFPCLWAEDDFVYDEVVTGTRFTHGTGFRFVFGNTSGHVRLEKATYDPMSGWYYYSRTEPWTATFTNPGLIYQAEWKYFMMDIGLGWASWSTKGEQKDGPGLSVQPMARYAPVDNQKIRYAILLGPNFLIDTGGLDVSVNLAQELGVKINDRFMPFLGLGLGLNIYGENVTDLIRDSYGSQAKSVEGESADIRFQFTLGLKTMVLEDVFYYQGKEVHRRRR
jgi:opacity protein-like surface antigen